MHSRDRVEVTVYALNGDDGSEWYSKIKGSVEHWVDFSTESSIAAIAERIAEDNIQVLVNLMGHTRASDLLAGVHSLRPALIQAVHMGFAATMGDAAVNAAVTDSNTSPPEYAGHYTEKLVLMPESFFPTDFRQTYAHMVQWSPQPGANKFTRASLDIPADAFVFCVFNQRSKVDPDVFGTWMRILKRVPNGIIWMLRVHHTFSEARLEKEAIKHGVDPSRLFYTKGFDEDTHLEYKNLGDLSLDTITYSAHSTGADILWSGVPHIHLPGEKMGNRVTAGLMRATGLEGLIVRNLADYEDVAVRLANRPDSLLNLRKRLCHARGMAGGLFDTRRWTRDYERSLSYAWEARVATGRPFHIVLRQQDLAFPPLV
jgi:protein O-GlcNAc transferase